MSETLGKMTYTIQETANMLSFSEDHIRRLMKQRVLKAVNASVSRRSKRKNWRILRESIASFLYDPRRAS